MKVVNTTFALATRTCSFPLSSRIHMPEGFVILDNVFVPRERVFSTARSPTRRCSRIRSACGNARRFVGHGGAADQLVGFAQLIAEANGLASVTHAREKISEMIIHATLLRAGPRPRSPPRDRAAGGARGASLRERREVPCGGEISTTRWSATFTTSPAGPDRACPERSREPTGPCAQVHADDGGDRRRVPLRPFMRIRMTADAFGGWRMVTNVQAGGGLYAQRIVTRRHYDLQGRSRNAAPQASEGRLAEAARCLEGLRTGF